MSNLDDMANEYLEAAKNAEKMLEKLKDEKYTNEQAYNRKIAIYDSMYSEAMDTYYKLKNYYKKR